MSPPSELSFEEILKFMLLHNGKVTNHELVKHFKVFLMNPDMRDEARSTFKKHVNTLAIIKNQNNEKWLILKKKYMPNNGKDNEDVMEKVTDSSNTTVTETPIETESNNEEEPPQRPPLPLQLNQDFSILTNLIQDNTHIVGNSALTHESDSKESLTSIPSEEIPPKVHPRRRSSDKNIETKRSSIQGTQGQRLSIPNQDESSFDTTMSPTLTSSRSESMLVDSEQTISVKERKQMFNRMASESDVLKTNKLGGNLSSQGVDEEDRVSLDQKSETDPLDSKQKQWILCAARGDYHALAKMCKENSKLVKTKDPFTTAMHWACKRGDENLVKMLGGVTRQVVNERSGYTPLHIAMQFRHENVYRLLVEVYDADPNVRDWSGRKPRQYLVHMDTSLSPGSYRKADAYDIRRTVTAPPVLRVSPNTINAQSKKEGFLRIGSLNVRVKKTTEAFSNFLGVGATRSSAYVPKSTRDREERRSDDSDQLKSWGSADNIQKDDKLMPPPNNNKVRRRGATGRRGLGAAHSRSTPSTPDQSRAQMGVSEEGDSDSDSAAGFHAAWRQQRASNCT